MNTDNFEWTDEIAIDFVRFSNQKERDFAGFYSDLAAFKKAKSKAPDTITLGRDYEILSFTSSLGHICYLQVNGKFCYQEQCNTGIWEEEILLKDHTFKIHSVKRLSDNLIATVGEIIRGVLNNSSFIIEEIDVSTGECHLMAKGFLLPLRNATKPKAPLFTTEDGKEIYDSKDLIHIVNSWYQYSGVISASQAVIWNRANQGFKNFSSKDAAQEFIKWYKKDYSLTDIVKCFGNKDSVEQDFVLNELTKINK